MAVTSPLVTLTNTETGGTFYVSAGKIISFYDNGNGSNVTYDTNFQAAAIEVAVDEAVSDIATATGCHVAVTVIEDDGTTKVAYFLADAILAATDDGSTGSYFPFQVNTPSPVTIHASQSPSTLQSRVAVLIPNCAGSYAALSGTQTLTANNTFSGTNHFESTFTSDLVITATGGVASAAANTYAAGNISAHVGGGQSSATAISKEYSIVTVCASDHDSIKLPAAVAKKVYIVVNTTAKIVDTYPATGEDINGQGADTMVSTPAGDTRFFIATGTGTWTSYKVAPSNS